MLTLRITAAAAHINATLSTDEEALQLASLLDFQKVDKVSFLDEDLEPIADVTTLR